MSKMTPAPKTRREQAEEAAKKYLDGDDGLSPWDIYLDGWCDADSTPMHSESDKEDKKFVQKYLATFINPVPLISEYVRGRVRDEVSYALRAGCSHARRTQAAEIEKLREDFCRAEDERIEAVKRYERAEQVHAEATELRALLERAIKYADDIRYKRFHTDSPAGHNVWVGLHEDYEKLIGKKGS